MKTSAYLDNQRGAAAVETAIIFMLLMIFIFGIIEFGLLLFDKHILTNASREGARAGIVVGLNRSTNEHLTVAGSEASSFCAAYLVGFGSSPPTIATSLTDSDGNGSPSRGDALTVSLTYSYNFLFLSALGLLPIQLDAVSTMQLE
jgi:Flp pilus assembly protein TadG